ncbi:MAG TPA: IclR family transcriptional regulator [Mycobacteriales bacterium]|nr:IclR family transcriptional regulator [Mycobacteriales bacterium]
MEQSSAVGVVDKVAAVLRALEAGPCPLTALVERTRIPRATAHRLATALAVHGLVAVTPDGYVPGPWLAELAGADPLLLRAGPVLDRLRDETGCSAQLYRRRGAVRLCVAASDVPSGLRDTVPVGSRLPMTAGSAAQVLLANDGTVPDGAAFTAAALQAVRRRGWAQSVAERLPGVASVSAPVRDGSGATVAAVSVSGPAAVLGRSPGKTFAPAVVAAAQALQAAGRVGEDVR